MNFKKFRDIGDSEPKAWNASVGTRFNVDSDEEDDLPVPYDDDVGSDVDTDDEETLEDENETETETESVGSVGPIKRLVVRRRVDTTATVCVVLQEELDFMEE
jgi:hypothetical protein